MERHCDACGQPYEAQRSTSKFCSGACRQRAHTGGEVVPITRPTEPKADEPDEGEHPLVAAARAELEGAGRLGTLAGQRALYLAQQMTGRKVAESGSAKAALDRQLADAMAQAMEGAAIPGDWSDELAAKRDEKRGA